MVGKSILVGLLVLALSAITFGLQYKEYYLVEQRMTWEEAQQYCREKHTDLAYISNMEEQEQVAEIARSSGRIWIGLHNNGTATGWKWSGDWEAPFTNWGAGQPNDEGSCVRIGWKSQTWRVKPCALKHPFICFDVKMVLVRENKTWEEALDHCRKIYSDLPSLLSLVEHQQVRDS